MLAMLKPPFIVDGENLLGFSITALAEHVRLARENESPELEIYEAAYSFHVAAMQKALSRALAIATPKTAEEPQG